jgi:formylglycine-generating enzyme required for sulfatase activity
MSKRSVALLLSLAALLGNQASAAQRAPGSTLRDCATCPELVVMKADTFTMGSSPAQREWAVSHGATAKSVADEALPHVVSIKSFALGKYDVTRGEYAAFVRASGYVTPSGCKENGNPGAAERPGATWDHPGMNQSDRDPVICVSWDDANAYLAWLNTTVGAAPGNGPYRLPTESEWEYAARAGTTTLFWWGDDAGAAATHAWFDANAGGGTHPVGLTPPNKFGLYDMAGNVWQWTQDCYTESYGGAPVDGSAATGKADCLRSDRGGSWFYPVWLLRSATRERNPKEYRDLVMGFRVAKSLPQPIGT